MMVQSGESFNYFWICPSVANKAVNKNPPQIEGGFVN